MSKPWPAASSMPDMCHSIPLLRIAAALSVAGAAHAQGVVIETPRGGWQAPPDVQNDFRQKVNYPASNVNTRGIDEAAQIRGHIAGAPKPARDGREGEPRKPARLIVDGIAMPLSVEDGGQFGRPWSFGAGAHGVEVRGPDGGVARTTFHVANAGRVAPRLRVVLSWDTDHTDLDLHVVGPDGSHVWYGNRTAENGGALDVDVTTGFGPEIFATPAPLTGPYQVWVQYYGSGDRPDIITVAQVAIVQDEGTPREKQEVFRIPMRKPGELTLVRSFMVGAK